ncbi:MAG TPA: hypothetical protein VMF88_13540 [Bacteroidota bacterium]|nr:hypothetical protein [Bacteroidota bacterium]
MHNVHANVILSESAFQDESKDPWHCASEEVQSGIDMDSPEGVLSGPTPSRYGGTPFRMTMFRLGSLRMTL